MEEKTKTKYRRIIENIFAEYNAVSVTETGRRLHLFQILIDTTAATDFFKSKCDQLDKEYIFDLDIDVNYEEWALKNSDDLGIYNDRSKLPIMQRTDNRGNDLVADMVTVAAQCIEQQDTEEMVASLLFDKGKYEELCKKKNRAEDYRLFLLQLDNQDVITDAKLSMAVYYAFVRFRNVLSDIHGKLSSKMTYNEKCLAMYQTMKKTYLPDSPLPSWKAHSVYEKWKEDWYMDSIPDELHRELIGTKLKELLDKGFTIFDSSHNSTSLRKNEELEELISKNDITEELCGKYAFFRTLFDYKDGIFSVKDEKMMGKYLYKNRHELPYELVDSLFVFLGLNVIVKEKLAKQKKPKKVYKEIPQELYSFFADSIYVEAEDNSRKEKKPLNKEKLIHGISDMLENWKSPTGKGESRRYRLLYVFLAKKKLIKDSERELYKPFVKNLLCYRFSLSEDDITKVSDNIRKADVRDSYFDMDADDKKIYDDIKEKLTEVISVKEDINSAD